MFAAVGSAVAAVVAGSAVVSTKRIALVTGANKGIGKEVARLLGALPDHAVVLGCRDEQLGMAAAAELQAEGCDAAYCWVDLADPSSFESARAFVEREYGRLDALVNNAAVCYNDPTLYGKVAHTPFEQQAAITVQTNYHGALTLALALTHNPNPNPTLTLTTAITAITVQLPRRARTRANLTLAQPLSLTLALALSRRARTSRARSYTYFGSTY